jgi:hypothetical protein
MPKHQVLGFEPELMMDQLVTLLLAEGAIAQDDPRVAVWRAIPGNDEERARRWHYMWMLGWDHMTQHGIQQNGLLCSKSPCRAAGISAAIVEVSTYSAESRDPRNLLAATDEITSYLNKPANTFAALRRFIEQNQAAPSSLAKAAEAAGAALELADALVEALLRAQTLLVANLESPQFRQAVTGRSAARLLTAIYQHLRHAGGFSVKELARLQTESASLVVESGSDMVEQAFASRIEALEKRVASEDVRTWHPYVRTQAA